jgi:membrane fusion protein, multidrug efflux system
VQPGERVAPDARIVEIVDSSRMELEASVPPADVVQLRVGQKAVVQVDGLSEPLAAQVVRINPSAQAGTRSVLAYLALPPSSAMRQGLFARATIELQRKRALVVPASTVRHDQAQPYVLVLQDGRARQRRVALGLRGTAGSSAANEAVLEVTNGLAEGEVVLRGTVGALREGTNLKLQAAGTSTESAPGAPGDAPLAAPGGAAAAPASAAAR